MFSINLLRDGPPLGAGEMKVALGIPLGGQHLPRPVHNFRGLRPALRVLRSSTCANAPLPTFSFTVDSHSAGRSLS